MDWLCTLWNWLTNNGGDILGGAVGILVGYGASELFAVRKAARERQRIRTLIAEEVALNYAGVKRLQQYLDDNPTNKSLALGVALGPRPAFVNVTTTSIFGRVPDALSDEETQRLLQLQADLETIGGIWESLRNAHHADILSTPPPDEHVIGPMGMIEQTRSRTPRPPMILASVVKLLWPTFTGTLQLILNRDKDLADRIRPTTKTRFWQIWKSAHSNHN